MSNGLAEDVPRAKDETDYPNTYWLRAIFSDQHNYSDAKTSHL